MSAPVDKPSTAAPTSPAMAATSAKPTLPALKTPVSATYPSELRSPQVATPSFVKREEGEKTPITPPAAYVDFLKALSPALMSPMPTGTSTKFTFEERPPTATLSPGAWSLDGKTKDTRAVSVRQVVTRTVTYTRTPVDAAHVAPLDPAPKGKRRRIK
ncbi:hypothetical protein UCDDS831_g06825 [Diplodia seriata]|uniref:Uncharacterized protein n=1 Tax=Diplodia seriata TaxID=420778 RepID=A0A0G2E336_9PEZI|nr:hypothetical protein UCDDS831_g06825 [Diplodia seriata]